MPRRFPILSTGNITHVYKFNGVEWIDDSETWKVSFDPAASTEYRIRVSVSYLANEVSLNHDLFLVSTTDLGTKTNGSVRLYASSNTNHTLAVVDSNVRSVQFPGSTIPGDLIVKDEDPTVSSSLNSGVGKAYKRLKLNETFISANPTLTHVWVVVRFIGDYIKPDSFNQDLHLEASVAHKNLYVNGNFEVTGTSTLESADLSTLKIDDSISGDLIKTFNKNSGTDKHILTRELLSQKLFLKSGSIFTSTIQNFTTSDTAWYQLATTKDATISGHITGVSGSSLTEWNSWKDKPSSLAIFSKITEITNFNGDVVTYQNSVTSDSNVKHALALQYNPRSRTWQAGSLGDANEFSNFDSTDQAWFDDSSNYIGPKLRGNLPFIVRSKNQKSSALQGRIPFFNQTPGYEDLLDITPTFKVVGTGDSLFFSVPNFSIQQTISTRESVLEINRLSINKPLTGTLPNSNLTLESNIVLYNAVQDLSSQVRYSYSTLSFNNEILTLGIKPPSATDEFYNSSSIIGILTYNAKYDTPYDLLTLGNSSGSVYLNTKSVRFSLNAETIKIGTHTSTNLIYGNTTFFSDDAETGDLDGRGNESTTRVLTLRLPAPSNTDANRPLFESGEIVRLTTDGLIRSPSIDKIWMMFRSIITDKGTTALQNENTWWNAPTSTADNTLYAEISSVVSNPLISTYTPAEYNISAIPLTLRQLEIFILKNQYNLTTFVNYVKSRKVDKGLNGNDGNSEDYGTLWQLHKTETPYDGSLIHPGLSTVDRSNVYLAADGTWQYLFNETLLPVKDE